MPSYTPPTSYTGTKNGDIIYGSAQNDYIFGAGGDERPAATRGAGSNKSGARSGYPFDHDYG